MKREVIDSRCFSDMMRPLFADFFSGIGLVRAALEPLSWLCVFANDIDEDKADSYRRNFGGDDFAPGDIADIRTDQIPDGLELVTAGFPCIDLSLAGNRAGLHGKDSGTFWHFRRILAELQEEGRPVPRLLIENVQGFLTSHGGDDLESAVGTLNAIGYRCDLVLLDAKHFAPQSRPRIFIIGEHETVSPPTLRPTQALVERESVLRPPAIVRFVGSRPRLKWGHIDFPEPPARDGRVEDVLERVHHMSPLWWSEGRVEKLLASMKPIHIARLEELLRTKKGGVGTIYRRTREGASAAELRTDGLAGCLRTPRGGSSKQFLLVARNGKVRVRNMTPREYARLQGVPESFEIGDDVNKALYGFGDAVCVPAVRWLAKHAFRVANSRRSDYRSVRRANAATGAAL